MSILTFSLVFNVELASYYYHYRSLITGIVKVIFIIFCIEFLERPIYRHKRKAVELNVNSNGGSIKELVVLAINVSFPQ